MQYILNEAEYNDLKNAAQSAADKRADQNLAAVREVFLTSIKSFRLGSVPHADHLQSPREVIADCLRIMLNRAEAAVNAMRVSG